MLFLIVSFAFIQIYVFLIVSFAFIQIYVFTTSSQDV